jgi:glycosyltransferase involved in cell wall biosynthesis
VRWAYGRWLRLQTAFIDGFVGLAEAMRAEMTVRLGVSAERIEIIPDPALRLAQVGGPPRGAAPSGPRLFLAVGRLWPQKDFSLLIQAFARLSCDDRLVILGEGPERARLEGLARRLGLSHRLDLPGHLADVEAWLARAHALVVSSRYEGVPAVVVEALSRGLPIVATNCSAAMEGLLGGGAFGELVPVGDAAALAAAMDAVGGRTCDVAAMRAHALAFTVERAAPRYLALMASLAPSADRPEAVADPQT